MGKNNTGFFYGKLYNSCNRTFSVGNGEKFIGGTGPWPVPPMMGFFPINKKVQFTKWEKNKLQILW